MRRKRRREEKRREEKRTEEKCARSIDHVALKSQDPQYALKAKTRTNNLH